MTKSRPSVSIVRKGDYGFAYSGWTAVYDGEQIQIGGNETYISVCRKHYFAPLITSKRNKTMTIELRDVTMENYFDVLNLDD